ncbi:holo-ACP synthase [Acidithiobacillus sulfuriphilus]|uniref:Holo-[acyl-carrier-protein] synthase n=2 Tax=Acidithiobacillus sulfuriphilus TaxID=1867749 RepID=A0A3M8QPM3_9PROT|nr:holo-ACP synthase [Acidithiobacillus sulfuriphilus]RNF58233.1 holo-[acyl-carrier-protein] synthase [Acidithiobacillus sulfuriphilus]
MIVGLGTDIVDVERMAGLYERFDGRLVARLLSAQEQGELPAGRAEGAAFLARRFAAKEAALKALGSGLRAGIRWSDLEVGHDVLGAPQLAFSGMAAAALARLGQGVGSWLSISDERRFAVAVVILEKAGYADE